MFFSINLHTILNYSFFFHLSADKSLLESRIVCSSGHVLPKILKKTIIEENRIIKRKMSAMKKIQQRNSKRAAICTTSLTDFSSMLNDEDSVNMAQENEVPESTRSNNVENNCESCKKCICKDWAPFRMYIFLNFNSSLVILLYY